MSAIVAQASTIDYDALLAVLHQLENPANSRKPGKFGELGPWQITPAVWAEVTNKPFTVENAFDPVLGRKIAYKHVLRLTEAMRQHGIEPNVYKLALAWNAGLGAVFHPEHAPASALLYADRANVLYISKKY